MKIELLNISVVGSKFCGLSTFLEGLQKLAIVKLNPSLLTLQGLDVIQKLSDRPW